MDNSLCASVYVLDNIPYHVDKPYDYLVPDDLRDEIRAGAFVAVPFGRGDRKRRALVIGFSNADAETEGLKYVSALIEPRYGCLQQ